MSDYPHLRGLLDGTVSGRIRDWPLKQEAKQVLAEIARLRKEREAVRAVAQRWANGLDTAGAGNEAMFFEDIAEGGPVLDIVVRLHGYLTPDDFRAFTKEAQEEHRALRPSEEEETDE